MSSETFKKRQKERARVEKKQRKAARLMERRAEKERVGIQDGGKESQKQPNETTKT